ncbi:11420_t:CDS:2 [Entrophospora sp. SA101]|nr:11420_t:CDS:2 [Entrophospora sp. SA101]
MTRKNDLPEVKHMFRNVVPLLNATIGKDGYFLVANNHRQQQLHDEIKRETQMTMHELDLRLMQ